MYLCMYACASVCMSVYVCMCVDASMHMQACICIHIDVYTRICLDIGAPAWYTPQVQKNKAIFATPAQNIIEFLPGGEMHRNSDGNASFTKSYKGAQTYVSPQKRHWPVYDTSTGEYQDASNYLDAEAPEDERESMLELTKEESWDLAPIRIFMELRRERGKLTQARASIRLILHSPVIGYLQDSPTHTHKHPPTKTTPRQTHQHPMPHTRKITTTY